MKDQNVRVPFLVCDMHLEHPIIGYNVITYFEGEDVLLSMMKAMDSRVVRTKYTKYKHVEQNCSKCKKLLNKEDQHVHVCT